MASREDIPRVSVGAVEDWHRLKYNFRHASLLRLDHHSPSDPEHDALVAHINHFVDQCFLVAQPNLRVNGHNFESIPDLLNDMEPFDEALDRRIWSLADTRIQWHKRIAETRRRLPQEIEATVSDSFHQQSPADEQPSVEEDGGEGPDNEEKELLAMRDDMQESFQKTSMVGEELDQTIGSQSERTERVKAVEADMKAMK